MNIYKYLKNKIFLKENLISFLIVIFIFVSDRASKINIIKLQLNTNGRLFVNDYLNLDLVWNTGVGFGLLSHNANIYYHVISLVVFLVIAFVIYLIFKADFIEKFLYAMILGGALGNFYDRLIYFAVPDFIDFHINEFHWFTFNIADIFITIGIVSIIIKESILNKR